MTLATATPIRSVPPKPVLPVASPMILALLLITVPLTSGLIVPRPLLPGVSKFPAMMLLFAVTIPKTEDLDRPPPLPVPLLSKSAVLTEIVELARSICPL